MPALPDVPEVIKSQILWTVEGDPMATTTLFFHYTSGAPDELDLTNWLSDVATSVQTNLLPLAGSWVTADSMTAMDLSSMTGATATAPIANPGSRAGSKLAAGSAAVVNYGIKQRYRGGKPRSYFPFGVSADLQSSGLWTSAFADAVTAGVEQVIADGTETIGSLDVVGQCVVSYYGPPNQLITNTITGRVKTVSTRRDAPHGTGAPLRYDITSQLCSPIVGSQRRRNRKA